MKKEVEDGDLEADSPRQLDDSESEEERLLDTSEYTESDPLLAV